MKASASWPGYFGAPARASAALGVQVHHAQADILIATAFRVLDRWDR